MEAMVCLLNELRWPIYLYTFKPMDLLRYEIMYLRASKVPTVG